MALVHSPEPEHPLRGDLAEEYTKDKKKFMKNAEDYTKKYAEKRPSEWPLVINTWLLILETQWCQNLAFGIVICISIAKDAFL